MISRREFVNSVSLWPLKPGNGAQALLRGVFPVLRPSYTVSKRLDLRTLAAEVISLNQRGAHGVVWSPSSRELNLEESIAGAEIVMTAANCPVVLGAHGANIEFTRRYARCAERLRPAAILVSPPTGLNSMAERYRIVAGECGVPMMAHARPGVSVEFVLRMSREIPAVRLVMDTAGLTLSRISEYRRAAPHLTIFTGGHGRILPDALERGASGVMPPAPFARAYLQIWNSCLQGRRECAIAQLSQLAAQSCPSELA